MRKHQCDNYEAEDVEEGCVVVRLRYRTMYAGKGTGLLTHGQAITNARLYD